MNAKEFRGKFTVVQTFLAGTIGFLALSSIIANRPEDPFCKEGDPILTILEETKSGRMNPEALKRYYGEEDLMVVARKAAMLGETENTAAALYHAQPPLPDTALTLSISYRIQSEQFSSFSQNPYISDDQRKSNSEIAECLNRKSQALEERARKLGNP